MRKVIAILLVLAMTLSLCACGGGNDTPETTKAPTTEDTNKKERLLNSATEIEWGTQYLDVDENLLNAKDKYNGKVVTVTGYIKEVGTNKISLMPLAPAFSTSSYMYIPRDVYLNKEDLKQVKKDELITVVGTLSCSNFGTKIENAYLVSDVINIDVTVGEVTLFYDDGSYYVPLTTTTTWSGQAYFAQEFWYELGSTYPNEIVINGVSVKTGDKLQMEVTGKKNYKTLDKKGVAGEKIFLMFIETVESVNVIG